MHSTALLLHIKREEGRTLFILYEDRIHWKDKIRNNLKNVYPYHIFPSSRRSLPRRCFPRRDLFFFIFCFFLSASTAHSSILWFLEYYAKGCQVGAKYSLAGSKDTKAPARMMSHFWTKTLSTTCMEEGKDLTCRDEVQPNLHMLEFLLPGFG